MRYERIEPDHACVSPDGHACREVLTFGFYIPTRAICIRCGREYTIVVLPDDDEC